MRRIDFAGLALAAVLLAFGIGACASGGGAVPAEGPFYHNSRNSLDWWGVYEGTVPAASGAGIDVRLTLNRDYTFVLRYDYAGRDGSATVSGTFRWDDAGRAVTLEGPDGLPFGYPPFYQVGEGFLRQLDLEGNPVTGALEEHYILRMVQ